MLLIVSGFTTSPHQLFAAEISKQQAAKIAQSRYPGRVINVKLVNNSAYQVKVLDEKGGMHIVIVNKQSGNVETAN